MPESARQASNSPALLLRSMLAHPRQVGAVWPTSRRAVRFLLEMADLSNACLVAEFGVGTGVYTREILRRIPAEARLVAFELDSRLAETASSRLSDPRLQVLNRSAEEVEAALSGEKADVIVSSLPFTTLPEAARDAILDAAYRALAPGGSLLVLQYSKRVLPDLERRFPSVRRRFTPVNVPPAFLFACEKPEDGS